MKVLLLTTFLFLIMALSVQAGEVKVVNVEASKGEDGTYTFKVSLQHADSGWQHYADRWEVLSPAGEVLATRKLLHPHVDEQPFTRSLSGVVIPEGLKSVQIRAHDSVHGNGPVVVPVELK